ncbi:MAG: hypothetical protein WC371_01550, partial [Parachlamydiales bacterium]
MDKRTLIYLFFLAVSFYLIQLFFPSAPAATASSKPAATVQETAAAPAAGLTDNLNARTALEKSEKTNPAEEKFYVLENRFAQLVFSNLGGSLAEINLPFRSTENPD